MASPLIARLHPASLIQEISKHGCAAWLVCVILGSFRDRKDAFSPHADIMLSSRQVCFIYWQIN